MDWAGHFERERDRYENGAARLSSSADPDVRQRQLTRLGNTAYGAGLALLMSDRTEEAAEWLFRAASRYRESFPDAPQGSWGRPIGAIKAHVIARNEQGAREAAEWALDEGALRSSSPIGRYAGCLALLVLGRDKEAVRGVDALLAERDFPSEVADALAAVAAHDRERYKQAVERVLASFEHREEYLEDIPVADTVVVLQALASARGFVVPLVSSLLPRRFHNKDILWLACHTPVRIVH
jgi:hypothetical protein